MYIRSRHRRGAYPLAQEHTLPRGMRLLLAAGAVLVTAYLLWMLLLRLLGVTGGVDRAGAFMTVEERGTVTVSIDGTEQRAENGMMIFPGESVTTGGGAHASMQLFDASRVRLDQSTTVVLRESGRGARSRITFDLQKGSLWVLTSAQRSTTGSVLWTVTSPTLTYTLAPGTEALLSPTSVTVYATDGEGITVMLAGKEPFVISEGQQWTMPATGAVGDNVFEFRSPLDPLAAKPPLVVESRQIFAKQIGQRTGSGARSTELLTVTAPANDLQLKDPTVTVTGTVSAEVVKVTINGYPAILDSVKGTFSQQVAPPAGEGPFEINVQAHDAGRNVLAQVRRTVRRPAAPALGAPSITTPAKAGETYRTRAEELILRGTAPAGAVSITVNEYKLQLFDPSKGEWSYVASLRLRNMVPGQNTYDIVATDSAGKKSPAARLTIIQGEEGPTGVVSSAGSVSSGAASSGPLPNNAPLDPGTLKVTAPTAGTSHTETGTGFLLEGLTSAKTATVSVNDYTLQLYRPGVTAWNYIVDVGFNNLKAGKNEYVIVARNAKGEIVDKMTYTVEYTPVR